MTCLTCKLSGASNCYYTLSIMYHYGCLLYQLVYCPHFSDTLVNSVLWSVLVARDKICISDYAHFHRRHPAQFVDLWYKCCGTFNHQNNFFYINDLFHFDLQMVHNTSPFLKKEAWEQNQFQMVTYVLKLTKTMSRMLVFILCVVSIHLVFLLCQNGIQIQTKSSNIYTRKCWKRNILASTRYSK